MCFLVLNVILWYHEKDLLTSQHSIIKPRYKLGNNSSYTLLINDINMEDAGDYYCEIQPDKLRYKASVNVVAKGAVAPQQASKHNKDSSVGRLQISYPILMSSE